MQVFVGHASYMVKQTVKKTLPIPNVDELFESLSGAILFSTPDLAHGYLQFPLSEIAKPKTGFTVAGQGMSSSGIKFKAISNFQIPKNVIEVKQFLGLSSFFRRSNVVELKDDPTVAEVVQLLEDNIGENEHAEVQDIFIAPPAANELTNEDSGDDLTGGFLNNLPRSQLVTEKVRVTYKSHSPFTGAFYDSPQFSYLIHFLSLNL
ncbi:hypothetical protein ILUMI_20046 [Ignelater luminosus]|uniref:Uncharacterized protein n=1 Tax=Ignelater luminosus TaxID=2038154 RepID=A0A8K0CIY5_IGNLU|nr:hypothetical protein ILUMI_20046 [Ignelater luminosus]